MTKSIFIRMFAAAGLAFASPAFTQVATIDPNDAGEYEPAARPAQPAATPSAQQTQPAAPEQKWEAVPAQEEYQPLDSVASPAVMPTPQAPVPPVQGDAGARASAAISDTVGKDGVLSAAEGVFGRGAEGLAGLLEGILKKQGTPSAYITGREASGAVVVGARYGQGVLHHKAEGDRNVYWTGPSIGFDFGADASKVFVLVYNLQQGEDLFKRFGAAEGNAFVVGGFNASYLRNGNTVLIPIRMGVGMRLGVNAGYMRFSKKNRWLPF